MLEGSPQPSTACERRGAREFTCRIPLHHSNDRHSRPIGWQGAQVPARAVTER